MKNFTKIIALLLTLATVSTFGQSNIWYVGENIKMEFPLEGGVPVFSSGLKNTVTDMTESSTTISDEDGNLQFSVHSDAIFDGANQKVVDLPEGTWNASQGVLAFPVPGTSSSYWLTVMSKNIGAFTSPTAVYYRIDVTGLGGKNLSISAPSDLLVNLTEGQGGVPKVTADGRIGEDYWLVTHEKCNNSFKVFSVSASGISLEKTVSVGPSLVCQYSPPSRIDGEGTIKFNNSYTQMAYIIGEEVNLFDFDAVTGDLTFVNSVSSISETYDVEFSTNGEYLYVITGTWVGDPTVFSIPLVAGQLGTPVSLGLTDGIRGGTLQLAIDGNIYYAIPGSWQVPGRGKIGRITDVDNGGVLNNDLYQAKNDFVTSTEEWVNMDLPNYIKPHVIPKPALFVDEVDYKKAAICEGASVEFSVKRYGQTLNVVNWTFTGANTLVITGGVSATLGNLEVGTTYLTIDITNDYGVTESFSYEIEVGQNKSVYVSQTINCPRVLTGGNAESNLYKWFDAPGGNLIAIAESLDFTDYEGTNVWVEAAGDVSIVDFVDTRTSEGRLANYEEYADLLFVEDRNEISEFKVAFYSNISPILGELTYELRDELDNVIGEPVSTSFNTSGAIVDEIVLNPVGWTVPAGNYKVVMTSSPSSINFSRHSEKSYTQNNSSVTGGNTFGYKIKMISELSASTCVAGAEEYVMPCCSPVTETYHESATVCEGSPLQISPNGSRFDLPYLWEYTDDDENWVLVAEDQYTIEYQDVSLDFDSRMFRMTSVENGCPVLVSTTEILVDPKLEGTVIADCENTSPLPEYELLVNVTEGEASFEHFFVTGANGVTWTEEEEGVFRSSAISENLTVDHVVSNSNVCRGIRESGLQAVCSVLTSVDDDLSNTLIYPTVVSRAFKVNATGNVDVQIISLEGKEMKSFSGNNAEYVVDELPNGVYTVRVISQDKVQIGKIIIE